MINKRRSLMYESKRTCFRETVSDSSENAIQTLEKTTPYMLRNDGELFTCGEVHPYIIPQKFHTTLQDKIAHISAGITSEDNPINWFIRHTLSQNTKNKLFELKELILENRLEPHIDALDAANDLTNQEFCRVRTSNFKYKYGGDNGEIYFRISSENFNWFNLIWSVVNKFKHTIKFVTVMRDFGATGERFSYYQVNGIKLDKLPIDEFLTLPGNPTVECLTEWYDRDEIIDELRALGLNYKFDKYSDAALYRILEKALDKKEKNKIIKTPRDDEIDDYEENEKTVLYCDECGNVLSDSGECPKCQLGDEDITEDIEKHNALNSKLWNSDNTLKNEVKEKINQIVDEFIEGLAEEDIKLNVDDIILIGSNCSYNYTKDSDLDIHLIAKTVEPSDLYDKLYSAYRTIFKKNFEIDFYGIPVELFVETENSARVSNGVYSVKNDRWIKFPEHEEIPTIDLKKFNLKFQEWEDKYNEIVRKSNDALLSSTK